jgi:hypothetical protein
MMNFLRTAFWSGVPAQSFWTGAGALWIFSAAVSAMDRPSSKDGRFYGWLYRFTHLLAANLDRALGSAPLPQSPSPFFNEQQNKVFQSKEK